MMKMLLVFADIFYQRWINICLGGLEMYFLE